MGLTVFPARAGMFLTPARFIRAEIGFPRASGDVPRWSTDCCGPWEFSPRERGCSLPVPSFHVCDEVFPARAGMFPCVRFPCVI